MSNDPWHPETILRAAIDRGWIDVPAAKAMLAEYERSRSGGEMPTFVRFCLERGYLSRDRVSELAGETEEMGGARRTETEGPLTRGDLAVPSSGAAADPAAGIGRYTRARPLARGGMGAILSGTDPDLERTVAIKVAFERHGLETARGRRFLREARITGQLEHPNIVPIHELAATTDGRPYFTMKLVKGKTLSRFLSELAPDSETGSFAGLIEDRVRLLGIFLKVCDAVEFAHSRDVIHRDLKPDNIMIGEFGEVLVMDWGLAKRTGDASEGIDAPPVDGGVLPADTDEALTQQGAIMGTPAYMAPEQASGDMALDGRADIWAMGAILYEMLTGLRVHRLGMGPTEVMIEKATGSFVPPSKRAPAARVPHDLEAALMKALAPDPEKRYRRLGELKADIDAHLAGRTLAAAEYSPWQRAAKWAQRNRALVIGTSSTVLVALIGLVAVAVVTFTEEIRRYRAEEEARREGQALARDEAIQKAVSDFERGTSAWDEARVTDREFNPSAPQAFFQSHLKALLLMGQGVATHPGPDEAWRERVVESVDFLLGHALLVSDWALARLIVESAASWGAFGEVGATDGKAERLDRIVEEVRKADSEDEERLDELLALIRGEGRSGSLPGELGERSRRFARTSGPAATRRAIELLSEEGSELSTVERSFLFDFIGRRGDTRTAIDGRTANGLIRSELDRIADAPQDEDTLIVASLYLAVGRLLSASRMVDDYVGIERSLGRVGNRFAESIPIVAAVERTITLLEVATLEGRLPEDGDARKDTLSDLADHAVATARSGSRFTEKVLRRAIKALESGSEEEIVFLFDLLGLHGDSFPPRGLGGQSAVTVLEGALRSVPAERLGDQPPAGVDEVTWRRERSQVIAAAVNLSRLGRGEVVGFLENLRDAVGQTSNFHARTALAQSLLPLPGIPDGADPMVAFDAHNNRGLLLAERGRHAEAIPEFEQAIALRPDLALGYSNRAMASMALGRDEEALLDFDRALEREPEGVDYLSNRGAVKARMGDLEGALADLDRAIRIDPETIEGHFNRASVHRALGEEERALEDYDRVLELRPLYARARVHRALLRVELGDIEGALADADRAVELDPGDPVYRHDRGVIREKAGDHEGAIRSYTEAVRIDADYLDAYVSRATARRRSGDVSGAIEDCNRVLSIDPDHVDALVGLGAAVSEDPSRNEEALDLFTRAARIDPGHPHAQRNRGTILLKMGRIEEAIAAHTRALEADPENVQALEGRGLARIQTGEYGEAYRDFSRWLQIEPAAQAYALRGLVIVHADPDKGLLDGARAVQKDESNWLAYTVMGMGFANKKDWEKSRMMFEAALSHAPEAERATVESAWRVHRKDPEDD